MQNSDRALAPKVVTWLGYGGLLPFLGLAAAAWFGAAYTPLAVRALLAYGAVILSFVGALHWAFAMTLDGLSSERRAGAFMWSTVPALVAWGALLIPATLSGAVLVLGFIIQFFSDRGLSAASRLPAWFLPLRFRLTLTACISIAAGTLASRS